MNAPVPYSYPLFEHMSREYGLTMLESELDDIRDICRKLDMNQPSANFGLIDPAKPPPLVASCKRAGHEPDSFVLTTERGSEEVYRCDWCRLTWREPLPE